jgi:dTDP-4-amino-4,6-dideoxygalactose transaminase
MIPRLRPRFGRAELAALWRWSRDCVEALEASFASEFGARHALAFPYGRSALWSALQVFGLRDAEIILPAYTCAVVANAVVMSGNQPRFVDVSRSDYNMRLDLVERAIGPRTGAIVATHLFGHPLDIDRLEEIVRAAERRLGRRIRLIQDCAHAFGATCRGRPVCNSGDAAIFGLSFGKTISAITGGMATLNDPDLYEQLKRFRDSRFVARRWREQLALALRLIAAYAIYNERLYPLVRLVEPLLFGAYERDGAIALPSDHATHLGPLQARVGLAQLRRYRHIVERRRTAARRYDERLRGAPGLVLPPPADGATYSHYVVRVPDRGATVRAMLRRRVELGTLIDYSLPHLDAFRPYEQDPSRFPDALRCSTSTVNLPIDASLTDSQLDYIAHSLLECRAGESLS